MATPNSQEPNTQSPISRALIIGATGLVGSQFLKQLLTDDACREVVIFSRRTLNQKHDKLREEIVDFDQIASWADKLQGDVLFSALGTTLQVAGSQEAQWRIDYDYQLEVAQAARKNGVPRHVLISSTGANPRSMIFYSRMKGQLEQAINKEHFPMNVFLRPGILDGEREEKRPAERATLSVLKKLPSWLLASSMKPVPVEQVARAGIVAAKSLPLSAQPTVWEARDIFEQGGSR